MAKTVQDVIALIRQQNIEMVDFKMVDINGETQLTELERTLHFPGLKEAAELLRAHPTPEGLIIKGPKRTSGRLFVPDLTFGEHIEMGENIFFYMGEMQECYVIYWLDAPVAP